MPYREELEAALARAAAAEQDLADARSENAHDHERIAELEKQLTEARHGVKAAESAPPQEPPKRAKEHRVHAPDTYRRHQILERVDQAYTALEKHKDEPTSIVGAFVRSITWWSFGVFCAVVLMLHMVVLPIMGTSPAGIVCPLVCRGCTSPARVFAWSYRGPWHSENGREGYAFVCTHPKVDVRALTDSDVAHSRNAELQPYMISSLTAGLVEALLFVPVVVLVLCPIVGKRRRRRVLAERSVLEEALHSAEQELAAFDRSAGEALS